MIGSENYAAFLPEVAARLRLKSAVIAADPALSYAEPEGESPPWTTGRAAPQRPGATLGAATEETS